MRSKTSSRAASSNRSISFLIAHDAEIADQELAAIAPFWVHWPGDQTVKVRPRTDDENVDVALGPAIVGDGAIAFVGRDDDIGGPEVQSFAQDHHAPEKSTLAEFGLVEFGIDVVMIEDVAAAEQLEWPRD